MKKVYIFPELPDGPDLKGDGGIRRVSEGMARHLQESGWEPVSVPDTADVIACHAIVSESLKRHKKPIVVINHGLYWEGYEWPEWALRVNAEVMESLRIADAITAPSEWVAQSLRRATSRPVTVVYHGIDSQEWETSLDEHEEYVLWDKSRRDPICDPEPIEKLAALLPKREFVTTFTSQNHAPVNNLQVTGRVSFEEASNLVKKSGVYLATTRGTFEIGVLQALAAGVPVVGWKWGGPAEFLEHGEEAWLCAPGDIPGLATGVEWALANRGEIFKKAVKKASEFTWQRACEQYAGVFEAAILRWNRFHSEKSPRTSIIVPSYNLAKYLPDTLDSVLAQDESGDTDWECIVVDDASTDSSLDVANVYAEKDHRFKVTKNDTNQYLAEARNIGIKASKGRYILPIDADDILGPNAVKILADSLDQDRSIHIAYGNAFFVEEDGRTPVDYRHPQGHGYSGWPVQYLHERQIGPGTRGQLLPYSSMFRREAWEHTSGYRRRWRSSEDCDFWCRTTEYGFRPKMVTEAVTLVYRVRGNSMSTSVGWRDREVKRWFTGHTDPGHSPAGAVTTEQLPIPAIRPLVTVVIPCGPLHEKEVIDAVDSLAAQTFQHWECVVVMNGVKNTPALPPWARVVRLREPVGPAAARNKGISLARGPLYLPLDADDFLEPTALEEMYDAWELDGDIIYPDSWLFKGFNEDGSRNFEVHRAPDYECESVLDKGLHAVSALTPVNVWKAVGGYDESVYGWEDWDFQIACAAKGFCSRRVASPLLVYRMYLGTRREENYANFPSSMDGIKAKWLEYFERRSKLMSCGCGQRATVQSGGSAVAMQSPLPGNSASIVIYTGPMAGGFLVKGTMTRTPYHFDQNDPRYVYDEDIPALLTLPGFQRAQPTAKIQASSGSEPVLVSDR